MYDLAGAEHFLSVGLVHLSGVGVRLVLRYKQEVIPYRTQQHLRYAHPVVTVRRAHESL